MDKQTRDYLLRRQTDLVKDQHAFEEMQAQHGTDEESILYTPAELERLVHETKARRAELGLMVTCHQIDDEHRMMDERDRLTAQLEQAEAVCKEVSEDTPLGRGAREARGTLRQRLADLRA